jgi:hypothetical protein
MMYFKLLVVLPSPRFRSLSFDDGGAPAKEVKPIGYIGLYAVRFGTTSIALITPFISTGVSPNLAKMERERKLAISHSNPFMCANVVGSLLSSSSRSLIFNKYVDCHTKGSTCWTYITQADPCLLWKSRRSFAHFLFLTIVSSLLHHFQYSRLPTE